MSDTDHHINMTTALPKDTVLECLPGRKYLQNAASENCLQQKIEELSNDNVKLHIQVEKLLDINKDLKLKMVRLTEMLNIEKQSTQFAIKVVVTQHDHEMHALQTSLAQLQTKVKEFEGQCLNGSTYIPAVLQHRVEMHDTKFAKIDSQMAEVDLHFQILETVSYDGTLMWKLHDYTARKQAAINGQSLSLFSQPFYSHRYGYKMCARVYLNGDGSGKGTHLSLYFVVMQGEFDNLLPWPFQQEVTMILLNQDSNQTPISTTFKPDPASTSFQKPTTVMNRASGCPQFVSQTVLETPKYIKDDTLIIKICIDQSNLAHP